MNDALGETMKLQETGIVPQNLDLIINRSSELEKMLKDILADHKRNLNTGHDNPSRTKLPIKHDLSSRETLRYQSHQ